MSIKSYKKVKQFASYMIEDATKDRQEILQKALDGAQLTWDLTEKLLRAEAVLRNRHVKVLASYEGAEEPIFTVSTEIIEDLTNRVISAGRYVISSQSTSTISNLMTDLETEINSKLLSYITGI
jgi:hypothetical protein